MKPYVYHLIDSRSGAIFYVGKGTGNRIAQHEREASRGVTSVKCKRIREIWKSGAKVERRIIRYFDSHAEALAFEAEEIARFTDLTNVVMGPACFVPGGARVDASEVVRGKQEYTVRDVTERQVNALVWVCRASEGLRREIKMSCGSPESLHGKILEALSNIGPVWMMRGFLEAWIRGRGVDVVQRRLSRYGIQLQVIS